MDAAAEAATVVTDNVRDGWLWGPTADLRYRKVLYGQPVLQQRWIVVRAFGKHRTDKIYIKPDPEWRDIPVEVV